MAEQWRHESKNFVFIVYRNGTITIFSIRNNGLFTTKEEGVSLQLVSSKQHKVTNGSSEFREAVMHGLAFPHHVYKLFPKKLPCEADVTVS